MCRPSIQQVWSNINLEFTVRRRHSFNSASVFLRVACAGASRPLSGESQASFTRPKAQELRPTSGSSNQRPATARAPRVNAPGEFAQRRCRRFLELASDR